MCVCVNTYVYIGYWKLTEKILELVMFVYFLLHVLLLTGSCATHLIQKVELAVDISKHFGLALIFLQHVSSSKADLASVAASLTLLYALYPKGSYLTNSGMETPVAVMRPCADLSSIRA